MVIAPEHFIEGHPLGIHKCKKETQKPCLHQNTIGTFANSTNSCLETTQHMERTSNHE